MASKKECDICRRLQYEKQKRNIAWKVVAIVSTIIAVVFVCLYFGSGTIIETREIENEVTIENKGGGDPTNTNIGNIQTGSDEPNVRLLYVVIGVLVALVLGGVIYGYIVSKNKNKEQGNRSEYKCRSRRDSEYDNTDSAED